jgi:3-isopropylmalate dehydratase small subunit
MILRGRAWTFGDDVSTDEIVPGAYLKLSTRECAAHVMEGIDPTFATKVQPGDIVVGGRNFGRGSSRETAPGALKAAGVSCVIAVFFARIFFRNAINLGLPVVECPEAKRIQTGDELIVDLRAGRVVNLTRDETYAATVLPEHLIHLIERGGLMPYLEQWVREHKRTATPAPPFVGGEA